MNEAGLERQRDIVDGARAAEILGNMAGCEFDGRLRGKSETVRNVMPQDITLRHRFQLL
jgi:hypothetical protein